MLISTLENGLTWTTLRYFNECHLCTKNHPAFYMVPFDPWILHIFKNQVITSTLTPPYLNPPPS
eukprot:c3826_g1_i1 orf=34-225(-)